MGIVYLLCEWPEEKYKIGTTKRDVSKRISELQTGNSNEIIEINRFESDIYKKIEAWLHRKYSNVKTVSGGQEWFMLEDEDVINFTKTCEEVEGTIKYMMEHNPFFD